MNEEWKDIKGFEGLYQISNLGRVKSLKRLKKNNNGTQEVNERIRKLTPDKDGYFNVCLSKEDIHYQKKVHKMVADAFIPNPDSLPVINHKNENKNDNRKENLEWCTVRYNTLYGEGMKKMAVKQGRSVYQILDGNVVNEYYSTGEASRQTGIPQPNIYKVCCGERHTAGGYEWRFKDEH